MSKEPIIIEPGDGNYPFLSASNLAHQSSDTTVFPFVVMSDDKGRVW